MYCSTQRGYNVVDDVDTEAEGVRDADTDADAVRIEPAGKSIE